MTTLSALCLSALGSACVYADDWPQWMGPRRDGVWRETGIIERFPESGAKILWRTPIGGGYAGPAVVGNRVYVTDKVSGANATFPDNPIQRGAADVRERVLCLDARDGALIWEHADPCRYTISYPAGPRTTPAISDGRVYTLGAEGNLLCLDAENGDLQWTRDLKREFGLDPSPVWGFSSNPLIDGDRLICLAGGTGSAVVAYDKFTGEERWRALDSTKDHGAGYSSPIIREAGGARQLIVWHPAAVSALVPETGELLWEQPFDVKQGLSLATPRIEGEHLFVAAFYEGSLLLRLRQDRPGAEVVWKRGGANERQTDALHCMISTPVIEGETLYGVDAYGEFRALRLSDGERLWESLQPTTGRPVRWGTAFIVRHEDRYVLFAENGDLIFAHLTPAGYAEISRANLLEPTGPGQRRLVVWSHPAFSNRCVFVRNDQEIVCASLAAE